MTSYDFTVSGEQDAVLAHDALTRIVADLPLQVRPRAELLSEAAQRLRDLGARGGRLRVRLEEWPGGTAERPVLSGPADDLVLRPLLDLLAEYEESLERYQRELQQTNTGLLALHAELERQRWQLAFLDEVTRRSATSLHLGQMTRILVELLRDNGFADDAAVWMVDEGGRPRRIPREGTASTADEVREVLRGGGTRLANHSRQLLTPLDVGSQRWGVLELARRRSPFRPEEKVLARHLAGRVAITVRNAREYQRERELAETLQRAMLPEPPAVAGLEFEAEYRPASRGINIGGDWYDVLVRRDGTVVLAVGDVTGHGLDAAILMGQLQNALRAYALEGHGPARTLELMHQLTRQAPTRLFATAAVVELAPGGELRCALAGHLPPMLSDSSGRIRVLEGATAPMLGLPIDRPFAEQVDVMPPGGNVLLYTDGLVERRGCDIDSRLDTLAGTLSAVAGQNAADAARTLLHTMLGEERHADDVCLLVCRRLPTFGQPATPPSRAG
ncbi:hypothetical protein GCM10012275_15950 [Longimycelium tulufanense]|uniref:PPM-type phosphatase domain-containing protein n=1 Tax=Longimycelium tulufanense TaxID=907463 RepID=A0A8J3C6Z9_9PSEU|nr:GAF domain-containing SpoIIE family protein phosphatase [Longimycelium tulufanense]GGM45722.1 hypothetical protein GCM10012275_15950 [Longimycelium tulufanense]